MRNLHRLWSAPPRAASAGRNSSRASTWSSVSTCCGPYLAGPANRRRTDALPVKIDTSEWAIGNRKPRGFPAIHRRQRGSGARRRGRRPAPARPERGDICLTRRVVTGDLQSLELGLQNLAPGGMPTMVSVETTDKQGRKQVKAVRVIILSRLPSAGDGPALIAPAQALKPGVSVYLQQRKGPLRLWVSKPVEQCPGCEVFALVPFTPAGQAPIPREAAATASDTAMAS
ncbi:MAG: hypothetical protein M5R42_18945 [Rhodocyclaceae bacterium]|nr:hypothetical protein [Rhodocyclaceae bacterium]